MKFSGLGKMIGRQGTTPVLDGGVQMSVEVIDIKQSYGKLRYCVVPLNGSGVSWTEHVLFDDEVK